MVANRKLRSLATRAARCGLHGFAALSQARFCGGKLQIHHPDVAPEIAQHKNDLIGCDNWCRSGERGRNDHLVQREDVNWLAFRSWFEAPKYARIKRSRYIPWSENLLMFT